MASWVVWFKEDDEEDDDEDDDEEDFAFLSFRSA
jgi:hypothetical protein